MDLKVCTMTIVCDKKWNSNFKTILRLWLELTKLRNFKLPWKSVIHSSSWAWRTLFKTMVTFSALSTEEGRCSQSTGNLQNLQREQGSHVSGYTGLAERWHFLMNSDFLKCHHFHTVFLLTFVLGKNPHFKWSPLQTLCLQYPSSSLFQLPLWA